MIYFDNAATTRALESVADKVSSTLLNNFGNPSSMSRVGIDAEKELTTAKRVLSNFIGASDDEIYFTSGGTESNNWAVFGTAMGYKRSGKHIITTNIEHPAISEPYKQLEQNGFEVTVLNVDRQGYINLDTLEKSIRDDTILVSIILINNETGTIQKAEEIGKIIKEKNPNTIFHIDAVQAFGKYPINVNKLRADTLSMSGHKIHGPKGVGMLFMRKGLKIRPIIYGGGQQSGKRGGTDNVPGIAGLAVAVEECAGEMQKNSESVFAVKKTLAEGILNNIQETYLNGPNINESSPYVLNISFNGMKSEVLLHALEENGIYVSSGSACNSKKNTNSTVLSAMGVENSLINGAIRFSFSRFNTVSEAEICVKVIQEKVAFLRRYMR